MVHGTEDARLAAAHPSFPSVLPSHPSLCPFPLRRGLPACEVNACLARVSSRTRFIAYESISRFNAVQMFALGYDFLFSALIPACLCKRWFSLQAGAAWPRRPPSGAGMCRIPC